MTFISEDDFRGQLDADPRASHLRAVFGDWLQDHDDPRGPGFSAMGALGLVPDFAGGIPSYHDGTGIILSGVNELTHEPMTRLAPLESALPMPWFIVCWGETEDDVGLAWVINGNLRRLDDNVALAFLKLPPELQQKYLMGVRE